VWSLFKKALFCWPCLLLSTVKQNVWVCKGYSDLKNLSTSVKNHESSKEHLTNILSLKRLENNTTTIKDALTEHSALSIKLYNEEVRKNRILLSYLIDVPSSRIMFRNCGNRWEKKIRKCSSLIWKM
jgi:hypothetical protein